MKCYMVCAFYSWPLDSTNAGQAEHIKQAPGNDTPPGIDQSYTTRTSFVTRKVQPVRRATQCPSDKETRYDTHVDIASHAKTPDPYPPLTPSSPWAAAYGQ